MQLTRVKTLSNDFQWNMYLKQPYVKFQCIHGDIYQTFAPMVSHSPPNLKAIWLTKKIMYNCKDEKENMKNVPMLCGFSFSTKPLVLVLTLWKFIWNFFRLANFSLGATTRNHVAKITKKLDPILEIKFHLLIH